MGLLPVCLNSHNFSPYSELNLYMQTVFLRVLEYYAGILFLTTNRIGDFDEAFASRIHVSLYYPPLDLKSTRKIFKLNLRLIKERFQEKNRSITINKKEILNYASEYWEKNEKMRWNGRQIRNACQTALAIAEFDAQKDASGDENAKDAQVTLSDGHINTVFAAYLEFMRYLKNIYGKDADRVAKDMGIRAREAAIARIVDDDDDSSDSDDDNKKRKKKAEPQPPQTPPTLSPPAIPFLDNKIPTATETNPSPNLATPSLATTNGSPTPSISAAAGHYQLSSGQPQPQAQAQAPNPYMVPNGYPAGGPPPNFFPPYMNMMYTPQAFMQGQGQYPNMASQQPQVQAQMQTQTQATLAPGSPPQMPNASSAQMPNMMPQMPQMTPQMAAQMAAQGWPSMNWQGMQGGPMVYPGMTMGKGNESTPPVSQPGS